jgi:hypothetical protein
MVDSSKTAWGSAFMPFRLKSRLGRRFMLVHLVRDPRAVCWSTIRSLVKPKPQHRRPSPLLRCLQTTISWSAANLACDIFRWMHPENYIRIRYEDLVRRPQQIVDEILGKLPGRRSAVLDQIGSCDNRHQLYGNAVRFRPTCLASLKEDIAWKDAMPKSYREVAALSWPLASEYGYRRSE